MHLKKISTYFIRLLFLLLINNNLIAMESPTSINTLPYYKKEHLEELKNNNIQHHTPCVIILDVKFDETPEQYNIGNLTSTLADAITLKIPTIVSSSVLHNLIVRKQQKVDSKHPENIDLINKANNLTEDEWFLFTTRLSNFFILIPKWYFDIYGDNKELGFDLYNLIGEPTALPSSKNLDFTSLISITDLPIDTNQTVILEAFNDIFIKKQKKTETYVPEKTPFWDFFVIGHGDTDTAIAGVKPFIFRKILKFFNDYIVTNVAYVTSCNAAGKNLKLIQFANTGAAQLLNYILIIGATTDAPVYGHIDLISFFDGAASLEDKSNSLDRLLTKVLPETEMELSQFISNIPQIWLPGGLGFQTYNIHNRIENIGLVKNLVHEIEHKPFEINKKLAVLIYPSKINVPMEVNVASTPVHSEEKREWISLSVSFGGQIFEKYPTFISMLPGDAIHFFKHITVVTPSFERMGLLTFMRDSFLNISGRETKKTTLIDTLHGNNDFEDILMAERRKRVKRVGKTAIKEPLHELVNLPSDLELKKVIIESSGKLLYNPSAETEQQQFLFHIYIAFEFQGNAWEFTATQDTIKNEPIGWNFKKIDVLQHQQYYNKLQKKLDYQIREREIIPVPTLFKKFDWNKFIIVEALKLIRSTEEFNKISKQPKIYPALNSFLRIVRDPSQTFYAQLFSPNIGIFDVNEEVNNYHLFSTKKQKPTTIFNIITWLSYWIQMQREDFKKQIFFSNQLPLYNDLSSTLELNRLLSGRINIPTKDTYLLEELLNPEIGKPIILAPFIVEITHYHDTISFNLEFIFKELGWQLSTSVYKKDKRGLPAYYPWVVKQISAEDVAHKFNRYKQQILVYKFQRYKQQIEEPQEKKPQKSLKDIILKKLKEYKESSKSE